MKALKSMGVDSFGKLAEADPRRIEIVSGRKYPFGNQIKDSLQTLPPKVEMKAEEIELQGLGKAKVLITLTRLSQPFISNRRYYADMVIPSVTNLGLWQRLSFLHFLGMELQQQKVLTFSFCRLLVHNKII